MGEIPGLRSNGVLHPNGTSNDDSASALHAESIEEQLARILNSQALSGSIRLKDFLEFTIRQYLSGNGDALKEYSLALEVFKKPVSYDPAVDSTVRSAAVRLRAKLRTYYENEGRYDPILIEYPGGHYVPRFSVRTQPADVAPSAPEPDSLSSGGKTGPAFGALGLDGNGRVPVALPRKAWLIEEPPPAATPHRRAWRTALAAFVLGLLLATIAYRWLVQTPSPTWNARRNSVAVLRFQNLSNVEGSTWLSPAFAEMFRADLAAGEKVRIVSGEQTARAGAELDFPDTASPSKEALGHLFRNLGADLVVTGSYVELGGGDIRLDIHVQDAASGETIATVSERGTKDKLFDLVSDTGTELRAKLGLPALAGTDYAGFRASVPSSLSALQLYSQGVEKLRRFEASDARDLLSNAAAMEPAYPLVHSALAEAWSALGYDENARKEAAKALDLVNGLPREPRWLVEGRYREMTKDWDKAIAAYKTLWAFHPDDPDYGFLLAAAQTSSGKGVAALATVAEMRTVLRGAKTGERREPRVELAEALARQSLSQYPQELAAAQRAAKIGTDDKAWLVVARAKIAEGMALWRIGELNKATMAFDKAKTLFDGVGEKRGTAAALNAIANVATDQGDLTTMKKTYEEAVALYREIGDKGGLATALNDLGVLQKNLRNRKVARKLYDESVAVSREIGDRHGEARALFNMAALLWNNSSPGPLPLYRQALTIFEESGSKSGQVAVLNEMGVWANNHEQLKEALAAFDRNFALSRETGSKGDAAFALGNRADVLFNLGRLPEAKKSLEDSIAIYSALNLPLGAVRLRNRLGNVFYHMGDLKEARRQVERVADILSQQSRNNAASKSLQGEARYAVLGLAALDLEDGRFAEAESALKRISGKYAIEKNAEGEVLASIPLAKCLLRERKYREGGKAIDRADALRRRVLRLAVGPEFALEIAIIRAQTQAGLGDTPGALRSLRAVIAQTRSQEFRGFELQARLAAAEIKLKSSQKSAARQELGALADEARVQGFGLIARQATEVAK